MPIPSRAPISSQDFSVTRASEYSWESAIKAGDFNRLAPTQNEYVSKPAKKQEEAQADRLKLRPNCAQIFLKQSKNVKKYRARSKRETEEKTFEYCVFLLFSATWLSAWLLTHGRSHRFKSCIAHHSFQ
jgi:hypothetical protein